MSQQASYQIKTSELVKVVASGWLGTAMEFMDFQLYSLAAAIVFNEIFFPESDPAMGLIMAMGTYGAGYVARLVGAFVFGHVGDKMGRRTVLFVTITLMGLASTLIGFLPTYSEVGIWAPAGLVALRIIQGLGAGAEISGAGVMVTEFCETKTRGLVGSLVGLGTSSGTLLANLIGSMGPVIIFFTIGIGILTVLNANTDWAKGWEVLYDLRSTKSWWFSTYEFLDSAWFSGVLYASCMVFGSIPFLTGLGGKANSRREAFLGGFLGGVALMIASALMMAAMLCFPAEVAKLQVPNLFLAQQFAPALALIFSVILLLGIYSTAAPMFWVVINKLEQWMPNKTVKMVVTVVLGVVAYFGAQIGFGKLIGFLYPLMGQVGVLMIIVVLVKVFILKDNKDPGLEREE